MKPPQGHAWHQARCPAGSAPRGSAPHCCPGEPAFYFRARSGPRASRGLRGPPGASRTWLLLCFSAVGPRGRRLPWPAGCAPTEGSVSRGAPRRPSAFRGRRGGLAEGHRASPGQTARGGSPSAGTRPPSPALSTAPPTRRAPGSAASALPCPPSGQLAWASLTSLLPRATGEKGRESRPGRPPARWRHTWAHRLALLSSPNPNTSSAQVTDSVSASGSRGPRRDRGRRPARSAVGAWPRSTSSRGSRLPVSQVGGLPADPFPRPPPRTVHMPAPPDQTPPSQILAGSGKGFVRPGWPWWGPQRCHLTTAPWRGGGPGPREAGPPAASPQDRPSPPAPPRRRGRVPTDSRRRRFCPQELTASSPKHCGLRPEEQTL